jgi:hypothetical protein
VSGAIELLLVVLAWFGLAVVVVETERWIYHRRDQREEQRRREQVDGGAP